MNEKPHSGKGKQALDAKKTLATGLGAAGIALAASGQKKDLNTHLKKLAVKSALAPMSGLALHEIYVTAYRQVYKISPGDYTKPRAGMMKKVLERLYGEGTSDAEIAKFIFDWVENWGDFQNWAKTNLTLTIKGMRPNHSEITRYALEGLSWWKSTLISHSKPHLDDNADTANNAHHPPAEKSKVDDWLSGGFG